MSIVYYMSLQLNLSESVNFRQRSDAVLIREKVAADNESKPISVHEGRLNALREHKEERETKRKRDSLAMSHIKEIRERGGEE